MIVKHRDATAGTGAGTQLMAEKTWYVERAQVSVSTRISTVSSNASCASIANSVLKPLQFYWMILNVSHGSDFVHCSPSAGRTAKLRVTGE